MLPIKLNKSLFLAALVALPLRFAQAEPESTISKVGSLLQLARKATKNGEFALAENYYQTALSQPLPVDDKRDALVGLAQLLDTSMHQAARAVTVYEQVCDLYSKDPEIPAFTLRLGQLYREMGAYNSAINKLFAVLNSSLRFGDGDVYRKLVQTAQFEIAETYFASGDYPKAGTYFSRLTRLDLPEEQKSEAEFKTANLAYLGGDYPATLIGTKKFLEHYPKHTLAAEAEYLTIQSLRQLKRDEEALTETLKILRSAKTVSKDQPEIWTYWRQKTGNDLANDFYAKNDLLHALTIYQALAEMSEKPAWRWPAVYQIGLCFERLRQPERAAQAYQYLIAQKAPAAKPAAPAEAPKEAAPKEAAKETAKEGAPKEVAKGAEPKPAPGKEPEPKEALAKETAAKETTVAELSNLKLLQEMAQWRADNLKWTGEMEAKLSALVLPPLDPPPKPALRNHPDLRTAAAAPTDGKPAAPGAPAAPSAKQ